MAYATANSIMGAHCSGEYSSPYELDFTANLVAEVSNPRKIGIEAKRAFRGQVTAFVLYGVTTRTAIQSGENDGFVEPGDIVNEVDRRYSDFDWLMHTLSIRYPGLIIGTMPEKRTFDSNADDIVRERLAGLTDFLNEVLQNPYLEDDVTVKNFLSMNKDEFDAFKEQEPESLTQLLLKCPGLAEWHTFLDTLKTNRNSEAALGTLKAEFDDQTKNITKVLFASNDSLTCCEKLLKSSEKFSTAAQQLVELNGEFDSAIDGTFAADKQVQSLKATLNGSSRLIQHSATAMLENGHLRMQHANAFSIVATCSKRDRLTMLTVNELLKERLARIKKHEAKRQDRMRKDLQYKTLKRQERFEDAQKLEQVLETIKAELESETEGLASQAKGLLASELRRYSNRRFFELRRRVSHFANEQVSLADKSIEHWQEVLRKVQVDQEHMSDLSEDSLMYGRLETLPYVVDPYQDSTIDPSQVPEPEEEEEEEEEEEDEGEYDEESDGYEDRDAGEGDYEEGDESQEDEL